MSSFYFVQYESYVEIHLLNIMTLLCYYAKFYTKNMDQWILSNSYSWRKKTPQCINLPFDLHVHLRETVAVIRKPLYRHQTDKTSTLDEINFFLL